MSGVEETGDLAVYGPCEQCGCARRATKVGDEWQLHCPVCISVPRGGRARFVRDEEIDAVLEQVGVPRRWGPSWDDLARFADVLSRPRCRPSGEFTEDDSARLRVLLERDGRGA